MLIDLNKDYMCTTVFVRKFAFWWCGLQYFIVYCTCC